MNNICFPLLNELTILLESINVQGMCEMFVKRNIKHMLKEMFDYLGGTDLLCQEVDMSRNIRKIKLRIGRVQEIQS